MFMLQSDQLTSNALNERGMNVWNINLMEKNQRKEKQSIKAPVNPPLNFSTLILYSASANHAPSEPLYSLLA